MKIEDMAIKNIKSGWKLKDGSLYLLVKCSDNVVRSIILKK